MKKRKNNLGMRERRRLVIVAIGTFAIFALLIIQFFRIQIIEGEEWRKKGQQQHQMVVTEPFVRGTFYSNASLSPIRPQVELPFAIDVPKFHLYIDPLGIPQENHQEVADHLLQFVSLSTEEEKRFREAFTKKSRSRRLAMWLDRQQREAIQKWWRPYARQFRIPGNAVFFVNDYQRTYPFGKSLGQVLHTIRDYKEEETKQAIPTGGLELYFNSYLKGKQGKRLLLRSPRSALATGTVIEEPEHGADVYLTIDSVLQAILEEEIAKGVEHVGARAGWAVMMEPFTGEILALGQYPYYNPSDYQRYYNDKTLTPFIRLKAVTDAFEPGSTMKALTLSICLMANRVLEAQGEEPLFDPEAKMATGNGIFPGRSKPITDTHFHSYLNMDMAVQVSSNIYMGRLIQRVIERLGKEWYRHMLIHVFGFGQRTGVEAPYETTGMVPQPGKRHPNGTLEWSIPTPFSLAIGHNILVNSIQMTRAYAIFANGGYLVKPTFVRKIVKKKGEQAEKVLLDHNPELRQQTFPRVLPEEVVQRVVRAMKFSTKGRGFEHRADVHGFTEAGKTGTANKIVQGTYSKKKYFSSFVGFAPVSAPRFVVFIGIDEPRTTFIPGEGYAYYGSRSAAPIFRQIARRALEYLGETPDDPHGFPPGDRRHDPERADWVHENRKLQELYQKWNRS